MTPKAFFAKLYERLEIGRLNKRGQLVGLRKKLKTIRVGEYMLRLQLWHLRQVVTKLRPRSQRNDPISALELRFIRFATRRFLWRQQTIALKDQCGYGPDIAHRDFTEAERVEELFHDTFNQLCQAYHLELHRRHRTSLQP